MNFFDWASGSLSTPPWRTVSVIGTPLRGQQTSGTWVEKDPNDIADYAVDWSRWLNGDTIETSTFTLESGTIGIASTEFTDTLATAWLSGGVAGGKPKIRNRITTAGGRTFDKTMTLTVKER